jgi:tRNA modification GTPase
MHGDTIAASSTPPGISGLAVLRLSGPACSEVVRRCLGRRQWKPRFLHSATFRDPLSGETLDQLTFHVLPGPGSPTGEDVLEIFPHGNPLLVETLLHALLHVPDVRLAEAGEFTRRAFENGKIDLVQAEAVGELIHAQTRAALRNAQKVLRGELSERLRALRDALLDFSARLELDVDFAEEEADPDYASWRPRVLSIRSDIETLLRGFDHAQAWRQAPRLVFFGAANAGKSSLINALIGRDRLLVSEVAGTTRDFVEVPLRLSGSSVHFVDTAGLGVPVDALDALAMARTQSQVLEADVKIHVMDGASSLNPSPEEADLHVLTKSDLPGFKDQEGYLSVSSRTGIGLEALTRAIEKCVASVVPESDDALAVTERQRQALERARDRLRAAEFNLNDAPAVEILAFEVREACQALRELLGEMTADEVLIRLFSGFCIGK